MRVPFGAEEMEDLSRWGSAVTADPSRLDPSADQCDHERAKSNEYEWPVDHPV